MLFLGSTSASHLYIIGTGEIPGSNRIYVKDHACAIFARGGYGDALEGEV
jgi:hypothetical protein